MRQTERRQTSDRRQTKASLNASAIWGRRRNNRSVIPSDLIIYSDLSDLAAKRPLMRDIMTLLTL